MAKTTKPADQADTATTTNIVADNVIALPTAKRVTKTDQLIALLRRPEGASIEEMVETLGWLPHTARAALTGLKKKGHVIVRDKAGSVTVYKASA
jgi:predicted transcriptional regulator of viral defense system